MPHVLYRYPDRTFIPHITLAYRDVEPEQFREIWNYYKNKQVKVEGEIKSFCLLENTREGWRIQQEFPLSHNAN